jgi:tRNA-splicing ligase RtcB
MSLSQLEGKNVPIKLWAPIDEVESAALTQLKNIASLPWCFSHVAAMPDVHLGKGATVGSVVAMKDAIAPAAVGVDIGCGMAAQRTSLTSRDLPEQLGAVRAAIEQAIPVGFAKHDEPSLSQAHELFDDFFALDEAVHSLGTNARRQIGTLGGGNHFIELCLDSEDRVWLMLHSGSRNIGKELAEIHIRRAKRLAHNSELPDRDLAVFLAGTAEMAAYRRDLFWAQRYAALNRQVMLEIYRSVMRRFVREDVVFETPISCHHNYVAEEVHFGEQVLVTRKGAIRAGRGDLGIIPGSMGTRSYIVRGLGNAESFESASHGAGRRMSRTAAKKQFTLADLRAQTAGVECRKDHGVLDEIPGAYKSIDRVMENQRDLVEVVAELKQIMCIKG